AIEVPAARLAAERRTKQDIARMRDAWAKCASAVERDSADEFARLDYRFHLTIVEVTQNRFYIEAYKTLEIPFAGYVNLILAQGPLRSMLHFHDGLIEAIARGDPEGAEKAAEENFMETDVRLRLLLNGGNAR